MVEVDHLTKCYPRKKAVDNVSFAVDSGEIVGFLGPNGAGKTTTMRMLSGYIPASGGSIRIAGIDVLRNSLAARRKIGYLPENVPLYNELRVDEFLRFKAHLKGVPPRQCRKHVERVKELCGLSREGRRIIGQLSKGFRQRVGLADALLHSPELLILDEPTIGLDPSQIRSVRELIKELAKHHTIILSTHILPEVEITCQRVLIIHEGRIAASDTPANLRAAIQGGTRILVELHAPREQAGGLLANLPHVREVKSDQREAWTHYELECATDVDLRQNVFELAVREGWKLRELSIKKTSLEEAFIRLTTGEPENREPSMDSYEV
ncbi:MAG: ATP-binding cassette domain-containing protein [Kiritimatiellae bacterium]|nr:ATP-binding cassette domain-containing protein [Kiritimatiellia bacterium]MDD4735129.1 ATP-binding cassette domain-containing protein [Kiritimatiellia bacterium]